MRRYHTTMELGYNFYNELEIFRDIYSDIARRPYTIMVVGLSGTGKSTFVNVLRKMFRADSDILPPAETSSYCSGSCTTKIQCYDLDLGSYTVCVVDTPGYEHWASVDADLHDYPADVYLYCRKKNSSITSIDNQFLTHLHGHVSTAPSVPVTINCLLTFANDNPPIGMSHDGHVDSIIKNSRDRYPFIHHYYTSDAGKMWYTSVLTMLVSMALPVQDC